MVESGERGLLARLSKTESDTQTSGIGLLAYRALERARARDQRSPGSANLRNRSCITLEFPVGCLRGSARALMQPDVSIVARFTRCAVHLFPIDEPFVERPGVISSRAQLS